MKEAFISKKFSPESEKTISLVNMVLDEYEAQGYRLSLRQLYYQLVSRAYIPNTVRSYKNLGNLVSNARQAGLIDWRMIEDRGRETVSLSHWKDPAEIVEAAANSFRIDKWANQPYHIEIMVEKDALSGVLEPVASELDIAITANKGYSSSSTMYEIGKRLARYVQQGKEITILYLGDHDPSGIDMTRDVQDRLETYGSLYQPLDVDRLALNWDQIEIWQPPENPAKETDSRFAAYMSQYGESSWELDAVEPVQLADLVRDAVIARRDDDLWDEAVEMEAVMTEELRKFANTYKRNDGQPNP
jgi:hypothetical protein